MIYFLPWISFLLGKTGSWWQFFCCSHSLFYSLFPPSIDTFCIDSCFVTEFYLSWSLLFIKVNTNGVVSFLVAVSQFTPDPFPLGDQRRLISPFWGDVDTRNGGVVSYRESTDTALLQRATKDIRRAFVRHQKFTATWIFIATWDRVAFYGASGLMQNKVWIRDKWGVRCFRSYLSE